MSMTADYKLPKQRMLFAHNMKSKNTSFLSRIKLRLFGKKTTVQLEQDIHTQDAAEFGLTDVVKYRRNDKSVYVKHVFSEHLSRAVKPKITSEDINFFRALDKVEMRCYVLVYVKNPQTKNYDKAFFLDDYEAIQGIELAEANRRLSNLPQAAKNIRNELL
ncbi:hypothetical protein PSECIP111951_00066 [Pseudoalteromonas holothuriae]|uniref:Uncharacterized protein n=1 Tax=Pseudoalteromonas holothuriae TaxID=2963714 RepID=A0ABM9GCV2_9GAMM|nr:hypothetical protein [Pseudoalteromonas sp. CIP111951]CAH9049887.1 hypothetical protein PSECIP111951_00066 [Pseudoalteromonas sp. CIP111951]